MVGWVWVWVWVWPQFDDYFDQDCLRPELDLTETMRLKSQIDYQIKKPQKLDKKASNAADLAEANTFLLQVSVALVQNRKHDKFILNACTKNCVRAGLCAKKYNAALFQRLLLFSKSGFFYGQVSSLAPFYKVLTLTRVLGEKPACPFPYWGSVTAAA
jgi:hypothetical protein